MNISGPAAVAKPEMLFYAPGDLTVTEKAYESVFVVYSGTSLGSGFAIGENCVITNAHVIADPNNIAIVSYDGAEYAASLLGINEDEDIAVLVIENATFPY